MTPVKEFKILCSLKEVDKNHLWMRPFLDRDGYDILFWGDKGWTPLFFHHHHHLKHKLDHFFHDEHKESHPISLELDDILECLCEKIKELERKLQNTGCDCNCEKEIEELRKEIQKLKENQQDSFECNCDFGTINDRIENLENAIESIPECSCDLSSIENEIKNINIRINNIENSEGPTAPSGSVYPIDLTVYKMDSTEHEYQSSINNDEHKYELSIGLPVRHKVVQENISAGKELKYNGNVIEIYPWYREDFNLDGPIFDDITRVLTGSLRKSLFRYDDNEYAVNKMIFLSDNSVKLYKKEDQSYSIFNERFPNKLPILYNIRSYDDFVINYCRSYNGKNINTVEAQITSKYTNNSLSNVKCVFGGIDNPFNYEFEGIYYKYLFREHLNSQKEDERYIYIRNEFIDTKRVDYNYFYLSEKGVSDLKSGSFYVEMQWDGFKDNLDQTLHRFTLRKIDDLVEITKIVFTDDIEIEIPENTELIEFAPYQVTAYCNMLGHKRIIPIYNPYEKYVEMMNTPRIKIYFKAVNEENVTSEFYFKPKSFKIFSNVWTEVVDVSKLFE